MKYNKSKSKAVVEVTKHINKKGRLKGKNKRETRALVGMCTHHRINRKGHLKATITNADKGYCYCNMCRKKFPSKFYTNEDLDQLLGQMTELNDQAKYIAVAINAGDKAIDYFATMGVILSTYKKSYKKIRKVAQKQVDIKTKNHKKNQSGYTSYGSWGTKR